MNNANKPSDYRIEWLKNMITKNYGSVADVVANHDDSLYERLIAIQTNRIEYDYDILTQLMSDLDNFIIHKLSRPHDAWREKILKEFKKL